MRFWKSIFYGFPFIGLYFGIRLLANLLVQIFFGPGALYTSVVNPYSIDSGVIFAAKIWIFSSKIERALLPIAFLALYISIEVFLRGLMTSQVRSLKLGASGIIFIPAIVQAAAFSSGTLLFSDPILYLYRFMDAMLFGIAVGTVLWRTKRFDVALIIAIIMRFIDTGSEFFRVVMLSAPKFMGDYDLNDSTTSTIENIASSISFIQIFLIMLTPLILIVSYDEVWSIIKSIRNNFSKQWFGYIIIAFTFIVIDIIFSFFITALSFLVIVGYILALIALRFVLPFLYNRLPPMTQQLMFSTEEGLLLHEFPIDVVKDIKFLENQSPWYANPTKYAISAGLLYIYFLFIGAAYRLYGILSFMDSVKFSVFLVILPAILFSFSSYLLIDRHAKGYFFAENWRSQLNIALILLYFYNLLTWTKSGATADFVWRNVPFFLFYLLLLFPKRIDSPFRSFAIGLSRDGRYATFRWILNNPSLFKDTIHLLKDVPSDIISSGILILEAKLNLLDEGEIFSLLRGDKIRKGTRIGAILALAILKSRSAEGLLLDQLTNDDLDVKLAAFWSLGQVGNTSALAIMAKTIEENPIKELINVAEKAILRIDPMYPLAGLREQAILV